MITDVCKVIATAAIAAAAAAAIHFGITSAGAADNSTQNYSPSRFALLSAQINVSSDEGGISNTRQVMVRADTLTGQCWILELKVYGYQNFRVANANWKPIQFAVQPQQ